MRWYGFSGQLPSLTSETGTAPEIHRSSVPSMEAARDDVLAFLHSPQEHWRKIWSPNPPERLNVAPKGALGSAAIKRRTNVVGIFPYAAASSPRPPWPRSLSRRRHSSSPRLLRPRRRWLCLTEPQQPPSLYMNPLDRWVCIQRLGFMLDEPS